MDHKKIAIGVVLALYVVAGLFAADYVAGVLYFLLSKQVPTGVTLETWPTFWHWYAHDPMQRDRKSVV